MSFNPNATGTENSGIFGLPYSYEESQLVLLPIPWEVTTSYGDGTSLGPDSIFTSSKQIDLAHPEAKDIFKKGIFWNDSYLKPWKRLNQSMKNLSSKIQKTIESGKKLTSNQKEILKELNEQNRDFNEEVYKIIKDIQAEGKVLGVVGGDHSVPLANIKACSEAADGDFSILHIDAHADLRKSYQGFEFSHASIMRNVMDSDFAPKNLVQVAIRDYCPEEANYIESSANIHCFFDRALKSDFHAGKNWLQSCEEITSQLNTKKVYLSIDIDGFSPDLCPNTGTPVPGGIDFYQFCEVLSVLKQQNKQIVGFDLCEVSPESATALDCWDGNVGSRVLYDMCCYTLLTNG